MLFPCHNVRVNQVVPHSKGGTDHESNPQLHCCACNSKKGERSTEALIADLLATQIRPKVLDTNRKK